jgi:hypothetical protein
MRLVAISVAAWLPSPVALLQAIGSTTGGALQRRDGGLRTRAGDIAETRGDGGRA